MSSEARRSASIARHFQLAADLMKGREHDRHTLATRLGIKPAMADRLLNAAVEHLPGVVERRDGKQRKVRMGSATIASEPSYPTAVAACFGSSLWPLFEGTSYQTGIREALFHVIGRTKRRAIFKDIDRKFWFLRCGGESALLDRAALLDELLESVLHHRATTIEYTRFNGAIEHLRIEPLSIAVHDHQLYVIGRSERALLHPYRFSRIRSVDVLDEAFLYPSRAEYDPEQVFRDSFGIFLNRPVEDVELRLHPRWATYARTHRWHDSQVVEIDPTGVLLRLRVRVCPELEAWILGFGEQVEVKAPAILATRVAERAAGVVRPRKERPSLRKGAPAPVKRSAKRSRPA